MPANNEENPIESGPRGAYDGRVDVRLAVVEKRVSAVEMDVAVIRTSFATKDDVQSLRNEIHASTERIIGLLQEQKLEFNMALARQREEFFAALAKQGEEFNAALAKLREEFNVALARHREEVKDALARQREEFHTALARQREEFHTALARQRDEFHAALAGQREEFKDALVEQRITLYKMQMSHTWKLYGFASLLMTGVYFIARYVD